MSLAGIRRARTCPCAGCDSERLAGHGDEPTRAERWLRETRGAFPMDRQAAEGFRRMTGQDRHMDNEQRDSYIELFGFAVPNRRALRLAAAQQPLLEAGAGLCYWASELQEMGVDIVPTDPEPELMWPGRATWTEVLREDAEHAVRLRPERNLLICWPSRHEDWPERAIGAFQGRTVITVGEGPDGCTGTAEMQRLLERDFRPTKLLRIPTFSNIHDRLEVWTRR